MTYKDTSPPHFNFFVDVFFFAVVLFTDRVFSVFTLLLKFSTSTFYCLTLVFFTDIIVNRYVIMARWPCSCTWEECTRWAQSNGHRLCSRHYTTYQERQRFHDAEILANIRNNFDVASAENVHNQVNNNDNHDMADDPQ